MKKISSALTPALALFLLSGNRSASQCKQLPPVTDKILMLHFADGHAEHYGHGQTGNDDRVVKSEPLLVWAMRTVSYTLSSTDDPNYATPRPPLKVGRKSRGGDFGLNAAQRYPGVLEHFIYLELPHPLRHGKTQRWQFPHWDCTPSATRSNGLRRAWVRGGLRFRSQIRRTATGSAK
ncbi:MAG: hypothetical protein ONB48_13070 [candidate division KSB1 bacterium]|nr:hypothetical protein [candidate division KSB1 bacterium]MDZ7274970.1 hypothetical protein [candidate division KSB1 bacterium]MDZ7286579.1 hypothetical protein [candidate division KSB1 bacterium]MDZ7299257.1 hypothetical protein [candidate division KSB1 bacterium]MDZ7306083.1 hypothetical protein [candidate division KSB1 bacterium]